MSEKQKQIIKDGYVERKALQFIQPHLPGFQIVNFTRITGTDVYDATIISGNSEFQFTAKAEIKVKTCLLDEYSKWGAVIEKNKFDSLRKSTTATEIPLYINIHCDGVIMFDLNDAKLTWTQQLYKANNLENSPLKEKAVGNIPFENAIDKKKIYIPLSDLRKASELYYQKKTK